MTYLEENKHFDYSADAIQQLVEEITLDHEIVDANDYAQKAYYHIRDKYPYDPTRFSLKESEWKASKIALRPSGHCLDKAVLLISVLRAKGVPARLGLAKVINHIALEDLEKRFGSGELVPHGYVEVYLRGKWVKATPAFNKTLCKKLNVPPLEFDGRRDSLFQMYDNTGSIKFMEYLEDYGTFDHVPLAYMLQLMKKTYPALDNDNIELGMVLKLDEL